MNIIYHCFGGAHSSVTAAALHLGLLAKDRLPTVEELMAIPYFDNTDNNDFGSIRFMGLDEYKNAVYVLGKKSLGDRYTNIIHGTAEILGVRHQVLAVNTMPNVNWIMKIGGYISRRIGMVLVGRPLVGIGTRKAFFALVNLVEITRLQAMDCRQVNS
ncbi:MAG TPA: DUF3189 family protein [Syntrophomonadaceae bacterium]|nr:DUF3189 family protein [Syntrophomonadaceae bacterium]HQE24263.1 DUF3189 family protein [Syntrophomonadaceae bacterium]